MPRKITDTDLVSNREAFHNYEILETYEAGIVLTGTEMKSLKKHSASLQESYIKIVNGELWLLGAHIAHYEYGNINNHEEYRDRKLLMHKREIRKLKQQVQIKKLSLVPLAFYLKHGKVKLKMAVGKGKKLFDKRATIKDREEKRKLEQITKY
jgi:SsrA-binding protein